MSTIMSTSNVSGDGPTLPLSAVGHVEVWSSQRDEGGFAEMLDHAPSPISLWGHLCDTTDLFTICTNMAGEGYWSLAFSFTLCVEHLCRNTSRFWLWFWTASSTESLKPTVTKSSATTSTPGVPQSVHAFSAETPRELS